jgi:hypothetical protein
LPDEAVGQGIFLSHLMGVAAMFRWIAFFAFFLWLVPASSAAYDPQSVVIGLERGPCFGTCPVYRVTLYGDGTVRYDGKDHVRVKGSQAAVIAEEKVKELVGQLEKSGFFSLQDAYIEVSVTDAPTVVLSAAVDGKKKRVRHYLGDFKAPKALEALESKVDEVAGTGRWTQAAAPLASNAAAPKQIVPAVPGLSAVDEAKAMGAAAASTSAIGLETEQKKINLRRSVALSLRDEGYALQQKGQVRDAVIRYRQSLVWWPDAGLEAYVEPLERKAGFAASQYRPEPEPVSAGQAVPGKAASKPGRVLATIRNRSTQDVIILTRGETPDAGTLVRAGEILVRPVQLAPNGEIAFLAVRNGQTLATRSWYGNPSSTSVVPALLYDDNLQSKLVVMTGLR